MCFIKHLGMTTVKCVKQRLVGEKSHAERSEAGKFFNLNFEKGTYERNNMPSKARQKKLWKN